MNIVKVSVLSFILLYILTACNIKVGVMEKIIKACKQEEILKIPKEDEGAVLEDKSMCLLINGKEVEVIWENNSAVKELLQDVQKNDIRLSLSMYGDFEQVGDLAKDYTRSDIKITTESGDIILYNGNKLVIFYGSNTWSYTKYNSKEKRNFKR